MKRCFVVVQVLLFLQKEKEESPPEAQVKEENGENLKHCGHCQVLNGSNYTDPLLPPYLFPDPSAPPLYPSHLTLPPPPTPPHHSVPLRSLFLVLSAPWLLAS